MCRMAFFLALVDPIRMQAIEYLPGYLLRRVESLGFLLSLFLQRPAPLDVFSEELSRSLGFSSCLDVSGIIFHDLFLTGVGGALY